MALVSKLFALYCYISFRFLINVISVSTVKVIIFVNTCTVIKNNKKSESESGVLTI